MALNRINGGTSVTRFQADTSDYESGMNRMKKSSKDRADSEKRNNDLISEATDKLRKRVTDMAAGYIALSTAVNSYNFAVEHARISTVANAAELEKLRKASGGLKTNTDLLRESTKLQAGEFKLSAQQFETVQRAMRAYVQRGNDSAEVTTKVTQAVKELKVDGLKDLGVHVDTSGLKMEQASHRAEIFRRVMMKLGADTKNVNDAQQTTAEKVAATGVAFENSMDKLKLSLGSLLVTLSPLIERIASVVEDAVAFIGRDKRDATETPPGELSVGGFLSAFTQGPAQAVVPQIRITSEYARGERLRQERTDAVDRRAIREAELADKARNGDRDAARRLRNLSNGFSEDADEATVQRALGLRQSSFNEANRGKPIKPGVDPTAKMREGFDAWQASDWRNTSIEGLAGKVGDQFSSVTGAGGSLLGLFEDPSLIEQGVAALQGGIEKLGELSERSASLVKDQWGQQNPFADTQKAKSRLESMFGPVEEFNTYKMAFDALGGAVTTAMTAWIDGSGKAGKAVQAFMGDLLKGLSTTMAVESLKHIAYAIASSIPGPTFVPGAAAGHLKSAALFAGVAAAAAVGAKTLGTSASGGSQGGAGAAAPVGGAGGYAGAAPAYQGTEKTIFVNDAFGSDSMRVRVQQWNRRKAEAEGSPGVKFR